MKSLMLKSLLVNNKLSMIKFKIFCHNCNKVVVSKGWEVNFKSFYRISAKVSTQIRGYLTDQTQFLK